MPYERKEKIFETAEFFKALKLDGGEDSKAVQIVSANGIVKVMWSDWDGESDKATGNVNGEPKQNDSPTGGGSNKPDDVPANSGESGDSGASSTGTSPGKADA